MAKQSISLAGCTHQSYNFNFSSLADRQELKQTIENGDHKQYNALITRLRHEPPEYVKNVLAQDDDNPPFLLLLYSVLCGDNPSFMLEEYIKLTLSQNDSSLLQETFGNLKNFSSEAVVTSFIYLHNLAPHYIEHSFDDKTSTTLVEIKKELVSYLDKHHYLGVFAISDIAREAISDKLESFSKASELLRSDNKHLLSNVRDKLSQEQTKEHVEPSFDKSQVTTETSISQIDYTKQDIDSEFENLTLPSDESTKLQGDLPMDERE